MENKKTKVAILMDMPLYPYRIYAYNELADRGYDLMVLSKSNQIETYDIQLKFVHRVSGYRKVGPFEKLNDFNIHDYVCFDIVIVDPNLRMLDYYRFYNKRWWKKLIGWGHLTGRTSGNKIAECVRYLFFKKFSALVFYEAGTRDVYLTHGFNKDKLFVANNTQYVDPSTVRPDEERLYFLYVGRIQERKGLDMALYAFSQLKKEYHDSDLKFVIVGGGNDSALKQIVQKEGIGDAVQFVGPVHDQRVLGELFSCAMAYVSPGHVGLGVLHSFACAVPVITCLGRLHSVEISNCNPDNSLIVPYTVDDVKMAMEKIYIDKALQRKMSQSAYKYYNEFCTIDKMVDGIDDAIRYIVHK